jgi:hypothetical protein
VGPDGAQKRMCCPKPNKCIKQLPAEKGGFTKTSPWVCCPPERQVPDDPGSSRIVACCDPSQVSLQGKFLVGPGIQGSCCDKDRICGSGASLTCCQHGLIGTETCCGGTCVDMQFNRQNCGQCGRQCPVTQRCVNGVCVD